jgi:hypothetical protein
MENIIKYINKNFTAFDLVIVVAIFAFTYYLLTRSAEQFAQIFYNEEKDPRQRTNKSIIEYIYSSPKSVF